jgi:hypothetical protein
MVATQGHQAILALFWTPKHPAQFYPSPECEHSSSTKIVGPEVSEKCGMQKRICEHHFAVARSYLFLKRSQPARTAAVNLDASS